MEEGEGQQKVVDQDCPNFSNSPRTYMSPFDERFFEATLDISVISCTGICSEFSVCGMMDDLLHSSVVSELPANEPITPGLTWNATQPKICANNAKACNLWTSFEEVPYIIHNDGSVSLQGEKDSKYYSELLGYDLLLGIISDNHGQVLDVKQISSLRDFTLILTEQGWLYAYGIRAICVLDIEDPAPVKVPERLHISEIRNAAKFIFHANFLIVLSANGEAYSKRIALENGHDDFVKYHKLYAKIDEITPQELDLEFSHRPTIRQASFETKKNLVIHEYEISLRTITTFWSKLSTGDWEDADTIVDIMGLDDYHYMIISFADTQSYIVNFSDGEIGTFFRVKHFDTVIPPIISACGKNDRFLLLDSSGSLWIVIIEDRKVLVNSVGWIVRETPIVAITHTRLRIDEAFVCDAHGDIWSLPITISPCEVKKFVTVPMMRKLVKRSLHEPFHPAKKISNKSQISN